MIKKLDSIVNIYHNYERTIKKNNKTYKIQTE